MTRPTHYAVPVCDAHDEPVKPYRCQRCGRALKRSTHGYIHTTAQASTVDTSEGKLS